MWLTLVTLKAFRSRQVRNMTDKRKREP
jgi:hypothetical protein